MDITLNQVSKAYGEKIVLSDFSCCIKEGSICAVMAPSGTGKTTLLRLLLGLESADRGTLSGIPKKISALFQEDRLCPNLTIPANLRMALGNIPDAEMLPLLEKLGIADSLKKLAGTLSGGMARRASLARALLGDGELLILDEPFRGLDDENRRIAAETILEYRKGRTLIFVTHNAEDLSLLHTDQCMNLT